LWKQVVGKPAPLIDWQTLMRDFCRLSFLWIGVFALVVSAPAKAVLLASYNFENNLLDSSGNGHHGVFMGNASIIVDRVRGNVLNIPNDGALHGVNIDSVVPIPDFPAETSITLAAWYKRSGDPGGEFRYVIPQWKFVRLSTARGSRSRDTGDVRARSGNSFDYPL
jgi:hypothetical protein